MPVLIDLLPVVSEEQIGRVEDALHQLAGDKSPETPLGSDAADKKKCRDAWAAWWKTNGEGVDLARLAAAWYGYTLLCDSSRNRVFEIDRDGKERWAIHGVPFPVDAWVVGGNRVLIAEYNGGKVSERDFKGNILWSERQVCRSRSTCSGCPTATPSSPPMNQIVEVDHRRKRFTDQQCAGRRDGRLWSKATSSV